MGLMLRQHKYAFDILTRAGMVSCKPIDTSISTSKAYILLFLTCFRQIIGTLQYLTFTRLYICFAINKIC